MIIGRREDVFFNGVDIRRLTWAEEGLQVKGRGIQEGNRANINTTHGTDVHQTVENKEKLFPGDAWKINKQNQNNSPNQKLPLTFSKWRSRSCYVSQVQ